MLKISEKAPSPDEIWHPFDQLEEADSAMWGNVNHRTTWLHLAQIFTGNADLYGAWMLKVIEAWPKSCEHNLTKGGDKRPWVGHAAVALAINCPEDIVRAAWGSLSQEQQDAANKKAEEAIEIWRAKNA
jgi:hypothetical protein